MKFRKNESADFAFPNEMREKPAFSPTRLAFLFSMAYFFLCSFYILISGVLAAKISSSVTDLQRIETIKGLLFILVTTLTNFGMLWYLLHRLVENEKSMITQKNKLIQIQGQAVSGVLASAVAHDINNILSVLNYFCHELARMEEATTVDVNIQQRVTAALEDLKNLTNRLMHLGKENIPDEFKQMDFVYLIKDTLELTRKHEFIREKEVSYTGADKLHIMGNEYTLRQLLINLILNAATAAHNRIEIRVAQQNDCAILEVHDDGEGVPQAEQKSIFQPFYTSKVTGTGLGLLSVKVYTEIHHGSINLLESHLGGACFQIILPIAIK